MKQPYDVLNVQLLIKAGQNTEPLMDFLNDLRDDEDAFEEWITDWTLIPISGPEAELKFSTKLNWPGKGLPPREALLAELAAIEDPKGPEVFETWAVKYKRLKKSVAAFLEAEKA